MESERSSDTARSVSVVICAYTLERWPQLQEALGSVQGQSVSPLEVILVVDHNDELFRRARESLQGVRVIQNTRQRGLSGGRNCGVLASRGSIVAFLDDDAVASSHWIETLLRWYQDENVLGAGGRVEPAWVTGRPRWFPVEFDWVVGCTFLGMPERPEKVASLVGCNMSFRREVFTAIGEFKVDMGRVGSIPLAGEETDFCMRGTRAFPGCYWLYDPGAAVRHWVPAKRATLGYFRARAFAEGISKAAITRALGAGESLARERSYTLRTLPGGFAVGLVEAVREMSIWPAVRSCIIATGLGITAAGYCVGKLSRSPGRSEPSSSAAGN